MIKTQDSRWIPVRRGHIYCSPGCGYDCTYEDYEKSVKAADELCKTLGGGWRPLVWENLGWHYKAIFELPNGWSMKVYPVLYNSTYHAMLGEGSGGNVWNRKSQGFENPVDAVRDEWAAFQEWLTPIKTVDISLQELENAWAIAKVTP